MAKPLHRNRQEWIYSDMPEGLLATKRQEAAKVIPFAWVTQGCMTQYGAQWAYVTWVVSMNECPSVSMGDIDYMVKTVFENDNTEAHWTYIPTTQHVVISQFRRP